MKKGFLIANGIALFLAFVSIGWLVYDFFMFGFLRSKMRRMETLLPFDETLANYVWLGLLIFLVAHMASFVAIVVQFQRFRKASVLGVAALVLGVISCMGVSSILRPCRISGMITTVAGWRSWSFVFSTGSPPPGA